MLKYGRYVLISQHDANKADEFFQRWGSATAFFSHSLSSLTNEPAPQLILTHRSPSALRPCSQISGQIRDDLLLLRGLARCEAGGVRVHAAVGAGVRVSHRSALMAAYTYGTPSMASIP